MTNQAPLRGAFVFLVHTHEGFERMFSEFVSKIVFPTQCVACRCFNQSYLCDRCFQKISFQETQFCPNSRCGKPAFHGLVHEKCCTSYGLDGHLSFTEYTGVMRSIFEFYKRRRVRKLEEVFHRILEWYLVDEEDVFPFSLSKKQILVPVPLFWLDQRFRGFNPSEELAKIIGTVLEIPYKSSILQKTRPTLAQKHLTKEQRLHNLQNAFSVKEVDLSGYEIILVDDIWTTGATLRECAKTLKKAGADRVWGMSMAKGV